MHDIHLSALTVTLVIGFFIPIATGILTKVSTHPGLKGLLTLVFNAVQALIVGGIVGPDGGHTWSQATLIAFLLALCVSIASYTGFWKPNKITSSLPDGKLAPTKGLF